MDSVTGFTLKDKLYSGNYFDIYSSIRLSDNQRFILKLPRKEHPSPKEISLLQHEYKLLKRLNIPGVIHVHELMNPNLYPVLVLEDISGISLRQVLDKKPLELKTFFQIASSLLEIIDSLHRESIIHRDIKPENIIINESNFLVKLIDFSVAIEVSDEPDQKTNTLEGTLSYLSPEQTGRIARRVDYRSDFYSLGITFYEMLTGEVPFKYDDPLELIHAHLTKLPPLVSDLNPSVPIMLSRLINKLLAKMPEDRYSSIMGLKADLIKCETEWQETGKIEEFPLGIIDVHEHLNISRKVYGREEQINQLMNSFTLAKEGLHNLVLIAGYSGIGKTTLMSECNKFIVEQNGLIIRGKFDQLRQRTPYSAIMEAFRNLVRQVLAEPEKSLQHYRKRLETSLGNVGQVVIDEIPEVEFIIGKQPPLPILNASETQNRFNMTFLNFVKVFAKEDHPLVIFLDDVQWADAASIKFIELILNSNQCKHLMIIASYRENEVSQDHLLFRTMRVLENKIPIEKISLKPLTKFDIQNLLADTLKINFNQVEPLASIVHEKVNGNPFYVREFLQSLYHEKLLYFSSKDARWNWDLDLIRQQNISANLADLLLVKIERLPKDALDILKLASCFGNEFSLHNLMIVSGKPLTEISSYLWKATQLSLIVPIKRNYRISSFDTNAIDRVQYRFSHDRILHAVYELLANKEKSKFHLEIARLLVKDTALNEKDDRLFEITNQYNEGLNLIDDPDEKINVAQYNLWSGQRAKKAAAYSLALDYVELGTTLLPKDSWQNNYDLTYKLFKELAENEYLTSNFEKAKEYFDLLVKKSNNVLDRAQVYLLQIILLITLSRNHQAVAIGIKALKELGLTVPKNVRSYHILIEVFRIKMFVGMKSIQDLNSFHATDKTILMIYEIVIHMINAVFFTNRKLFAYFLSKLTYLGLRYGSTPDLVNIYYGYSFFILNIFGNYKSAIELTDFANKTKEALGVASVATVREYLSFGFFIGIWMYPIKECLEYMNKGYLLAVEEGDLVYAAMFLLGYDVLFRDTGYPIPEAVKAYQDTAYFIKKYRIQTLEKQIKYIGKMLDILQGKIHFEPERLIKEIEDNQYENLLELNGIWFILKKVSYWLGHYKSAIEIEKKLEPTIEISVGLYAYVVDKFYNGLAFAKLYQQSNHEDDKKKFLKSLKEAHKNFKTWSEWYPTNYKQYELILAAEIARIDSNLIDAMTLYDEAIQVVSANENLPILGIANELAAEFYLQLGKKHIAKIYFTNARYAYQRWASPPKLEYFEETYREYLVDEMTSLIPVNTNPVMTPLRTTTTQLTKSAMSTHQLDNSVIDLNSVVKSYQAISSKLKLHDLIQSLITITTENAGADKSALLLIENKKLYVVAKGKAGKKPKILQNQPLEDVKDICLTIVRFVQRTKETLVLNNAPNEGAYTEDDYIKINKPLSILCLPIIYQNELIGILYLENTVLKKAFTENRLKVVQLLSSQAAISLENALLYSAYDKFVPHEFLDILGKRSIIDIQPGDHIQQEITILFCDIRGFTTISEILTPNETFDFINSFIALMEPIIKKHHGFIDKYIGDAIMALFPGDVDNAINAALSMKQDLKELNKHRSSQHLRKIEIGVGINTGVLILGTLGSQYRLETTVISDAVNIAQRVQNLTKKYQMSLLITNDSYKKLKNPDKFEMRYLGEEEVRGKAIKIGIWSVNERNDAQ